MSSAIQLLIVGNVLGFLLERTAGPAVVNALALWVHPSAPFAGVLAAPWQLVTYSFLHANVSHLLLNMFGLWMFGTDVERVWPPWRVLLAYLAAALTGGLAHLLAGVVSGSAAPVIGASAGVFGLMLCYAMMFPHRRVMLLIPPIPMSARSMVILYAVVELAFGVSGTQSGVAHFAHLGGLVGGWLVYHYGAYLAGRPRR